MGEKIVFKRIVSDRESIWECKWLFYSNIYNILNVLHVSW